MLTFILIYLVGASITSIMYGLDNDDPSPPPGEIATCFFLWWIVLSIQIAFWFAALGRFLRKKYTTKRG